jgi:hypothetical protein
MAVVSRELATLTDRRARSQNRTSTDQAGYSKKLKLFKFTARTNFELVPSNFQVYMQKHPAVGKLAVGEYFSGRTVPPSCTKRPCWSNA